MTDRFSADELLRKAGSDRPKSPWPIDLAHLRPFRVGSAEVRPASCEIVRGDQRETLEPRVMQVLVALAGARGDTLSRDDLIEACWEGRAVSDDAVNRVISRLRALARTFESFEVETITKVGYRLVERAGETAPQIGPIVPIRKQGNPAIDRRMLIAGGTAVLVAGTAVVLWQRPWRHRPPAEALDLFQRAEIAHRAGTAEQSRQALAFYERAVEIDPDYADAWGALALAYTHLLEGFGDAEIDSVPGRIQSAANRALELDQGNADAQLALIIIKPEFRNWNRMEAQLRDLTSRYPQHWFANSRLAILLFEVGRLGEGITIHKKVLSDIDSMLPVGQGYLAKALSFAGRTQEADAVLDEARRKWPAHTAIWYATYTHLLFSSRPQSAIAFVMDPEARPTGIGATQTEPLLRLAWALDARQPSDVEGAIEDWRQMGLASPTRILPRSATVFAMLGRPDLTFASLERYFLNRGSFGPSIPIGPHTRRYTDLLFSQPMAPLRSEPRFTRLLREIGLEAYWSRTGTGPDFRRPA
jgi:DNA-binding winged helix-turn-helix (wHTH) protein